MTRCIDIERIYRIITIEEGKDTVRAVASKSKCCEMTDARLPNDASAENLAQLARALGHSARVRILKLLICRDACVCGEIVDELPLAQSTVSQHLKILKDAGLIQGEVDGPKVCYCINPLKLKELKALIASL